jgi:hypothetical protein
VSRPEAFRVFAKGRVEVEARVVVCVVGQVVARAV